MLYAFRTEIKKVLRKQNVCIFLFVLFGIYVLYSLTDINGLVNTDDYSYQSYRKLVESIDTEQLPEEIERLRMQQEDFSAEALYTENYFSEQKLYDEVLKQAEHIVEYPQHVDAMIKNAEKGSISIFQENEYLNREQKKTISDYKKLKALPVEFSASRGVYLLSKTDFADLLLLIVIILLVSGMITMEKEEHTWSLLYTTYYGRKRVGAVKFFSGLALTTICFLVVMAYKSILILSTYGIGNIESAVQSVYVYGSCKYLLNVGQFLCGCFAGRYLACLFFYALIFCCAVFFKKSMTLYGVTSVFLGAEAVCHEFLPEHSWLEVLKQFNLFQLMSSDTVIGGYRNINIFSTPADYLLVVVTVQIMLFVVFAVLGVYSAERYTESCKGTFFIRKTAVLKGFLQNKKKSYVKASGVFLFFKEVKKIWMGEKGYLLFLVGSFLLFLLYSPMEESFADKNQVYYQRYIRSVEGEYSDQKLQLLLKERDELEQMQECLNSDEEYTEAQRELMENKVERLQGLDMAIRNVQYICNNKVSHILYEKGYFVLFGREEGKSGLLFLRLISLLLIIGFAASIWGIELWSGTDSILKSSAMGEAKLLRLKRCHVLVLAVLIFGITYVPWIGNVVTAYGCDLWKAPFKSILLFEGIFFENMSIGAGSVLFWLLHLGYLCLVGNCVRFVQKKMQGYILTVFVAFVIFSVPVFCMAV